MGINKFSDLRPEERPGGFKPRTSWARLNITVQIIYILRFLDGVHSSHELSTIKKKCNSHTPSNVTHVQQTACMQKNKNVFI